MYCHTRNTRFTRVLDTIAVEVIPDAVAQRAELGGRRVGWGWRGRLINTGVPVGIILTGSKGDTVRDTGGGVDIRVHRVVASLILRAKLETGREGDLNAVLPRRQVGKAVVAAGVGRSGADDSAARTAAQQGDSHIRHARFAGILDPITIGVVPHTVAQRCGRWRR